MTNRFYNTGPYQNGLKVVLDVESFDYAYFVRGAKGLRVAIANALDQAVVNQDGFYIAPGLLNLTPHVNVKSAR